MKLSHTVKSELKIGKYITLLPVPANSSGNFLKQFSEHYVPICVFKITPDTIDESIIEMNLCLQIGGHHAVFDSAVITVCYLSK